MTDCRQTPGITAAATRQIYAALVSAAAVYWSCAPSAAQAQTANWTSTTDTNWNLGSNWNTGSAPNGALAIANFASATSTINVLLTSDITLNQLNFSSLSQNFFSDGTPRTILLTGANSKVDLNMTTVARSFNFNDVNLVIDENTTTTFFIRTGASSSPVTTLTLGNVSVSAGGRLEISRTQPNGLGKTGVVYANQINAYGDVGIGNGSGNGAFTGTIGTFAGSADLYIRGNAFNAAGNVPAITVNNFTSTGSLFVSGLIGTATVGNFTSNNVNSTVTLSSTNLTLTNYTNAGAYRQYAGTAYVANVLGSGGFTVTSGLLTLSNLNAGSAIVLGGGATNATLSIRTGNVSRDIVTAYAGDGSGTSAIGFGTAGTYSGQISLTGPVTLTVAAAGTVFSRSDALGGNGQLIFGAGTLTAANVTFTSAGGLAIAAGSVTLSAYGPSAGALTITGGTLLLDHYLNNDGLTLTAGTVGIGNYNGSGAIRINGGNVSITNLTTLGSLTMSAGTVSLVTYTHNDAIRAYGGTLTITNLGSGQDLLIGGSSTTNAALFIRDADFDRDITVDWSGGTNTTALAFVGGTYGGQITLSGPVTMTLGGAGTNLVLTRSDALTGNGQLILNSGTLTATNATFNSAGGLFLLTTSTIYLKAYGPNAGALVATSGQSDRVFIGDYQNDADWNVGAGIFTFTNYTGDGNVTVTGGVVTIGDYQGGSLTLSTAATLTQNFAAFNSSAAISLTSGVLSITSLASGADVKLGGGTNNPAVLNLADAAFDRNLLTFAGSGINGTTMITFSVGTAYGGHLNIQGTVGLGLTVGSTVFSDTNMIDGSGILYKSGTGTLTATGFNAAGGLRTLAAAGAITLTTYGASAGLVSLVGTPFNVTNFVSDAGLQLSLTSTGRIVNYLGSGAVTVTASTLTITNYQGGVLSITAALNQSTTIQNFNSSSAINVLTGNFTVTSLTDGDAVTLGSTSTTNVLLTVNDADFNRNITTNLMAGSTTIGIFLPVDTTYGGRINVSGTVTLSNTGTAVFTNSQALTGAGTIIKVGAGSITASAMELAGGLRITAGTINLTNYGSTSGSLLVTAGNANIQNYLSNSAVNLVGGSLRINQYGGSGTITVTGGGLTVSNLSGNASVLLGVAGTAVTATLGGANIVAPLTVTAPTTLYLFDGANLNGSLTLNNTLTVGGATSVATATIGTSMSGVGGLVKAGPGTIVLTGANAYAGNTTIISGRLQIGSLATGGFASRLNGGNLRFQAAAATGAGLLAANGTLTNSLGTGAGQIQWGAGGGFAAVGGDLIVDLNGGVSSTLVWAADSFVATGNSLDLASDPGFTVTIQNNINLNNALRTINVISGTTVMNGVFSNTLITSVGTISKTGAGTLVLATNSTYTAVTTIGQGVLQLGNGGAGGGISSTQVNIATGATLIINRNVSTTLSSMIGGGDLILLGNQTLSIFGNASSLTGNVAVESGTLVIGTGGTFNGPARITLSSAASNFMISRPSTALGVAGVIEGPGSVTMSGAASTVSFAANSTFTGVLNIASGTARIGNGGATGSLLTPSIVLSSSAAGNLSFDRTVDWTYSGVISGTGLGVAKYNTNLLTLSGLNSYAAPTTVFGGELRVLGSLGSGNVAISPNTALSGSATIGGKLSVVDGILAPGTNGPGSYFGDAGTIQLSNNSGVSLTLAGTGTTAIYFDLAAPNASDRFLFDAGASAPVINNPVTLTFNLLPGFGAHSYTLFSGYGGILSTTSMNFLQPSFLFNYGGQDYNALLTNTNGSLYLNVLLAANYVWTGAASSVWDSVTANWDLNGTSTNYIDGADVVFDDDPGVNQTITLAADVTPDSVFFNNANISYTLLGPGRITGPVGVQVGGDVTFGNDNNYTGGTIVSGTLRLGTGGTVGSLLPGSTIINNGYVELNRNEAYAFTNTVSGAGGVGIRTGTVNLTGSNLYTGGTTVYSGATLLVNNSTLPTQTVYVRSGGKITVSDSVVRSVYNLDMTSGTLDLQSNTSLTWLKFTGDGIITLTNNSTLSLGVGTYGGVATFTPQIVTDGSVSTGVVITGSGVLSTTGTPVTYLQVNVADGPAAYDLTFDVPLVRPTGNTGILKNGLGSLYLTRDNSNYASGLTYLYDGTIVIGNNKALGTGTLRFTVNASFNTVDTPTLKTDANGPYVIANPVHIISAVADAGAAIAGDSDLTITGTIVNNAGNHTLLVNMSPGRTLTVDRLQLSEVGTTPRALTVGGTGYGVFNLIEGAAGTGSTIASNLIVNSTGTLLFTGNNLYGGSTSVRNGTLLLGHANAFGSGVTAVTLSGTTATSAPSIYTAAAIEIARNFNVGAGFVGSTASLGGNTAVTSTFSGNVTFSQSLNLNAVAGGTVVFSGALTASAAVGINKVGAGTVVLSGADSFGGASTVAAGTLRITGSVGAPSLAVSAGAVLAGTGNLISNVANSGTLAGGLTVGGTVAQQLGGAIAPGGAGTVGTLTLGSLVLNGGTLNFDLDGLLTSDKLWIAGGALNVTATTTFGFNPLANFGLGTYNLIQGYSSLSGLNFLALPLLVNNLSVALTDNAGMLQLVVSESTGISPQTLLWTGATDAVWQPGTANWTGSTGTYIDAHGDTVIFNDTSSVRTLTIASNVAPGHVVVDTANTYAFVGAGAITGTTDLLKQGTGTLVLAASHLFTGPTTVAGGTLQLGGDYASNIALQNAALQFSTTGNQTISGLISGSGFLQKLGSGTTTLLAQNTFSGITSVDAGTLVVNHALSGTVFVNAGGAFSGSGSSLSSVIVQGGSGNITGTQQGALDISSGSVTIQSGGATTGTVTIDAGTLTALSGATIGNTLGIQVNGGTFDVQSGAQVVGNGQINVSGTLRADGDIQGLVVVQSGGTLQGNGGSVGAAVLQSGAVLAPGNSVGTLTVDGTGVSGGASLTFNGGSNLVFEFNNATGTFGGGGIGGWDYVDLVASSGTLFLNATAASQVNVDVRSLTNPFTNPPGNISGTADNFNNAPGTAGNIQTYYWKFIGLVDASHLVFAGEDNLSRRFNLVDDGLGGVFYDSGSPNGNPFQRPVSSLGQGTFSVVAGEWNGQGYGLYIHYSAVPEPGSMLLAGLGAGAAGWHGKRRRKQAIPGGDRQAA